MKRPEDDKWLDEALAEVIGSEKPKADFEKWRQTHPEAVEMLTSRVSRQTSATQHSLNIRRIIMKSPITKIAAPAVIIIACFTGLFFWKSTGSGIALADVLTRIEQVTGYTYQMSSTIKRSWQPTSSKWTSNILVSKENGIKMTITSVDPNSYQGSYRWVRQAVGDEVYLLPQLSYLITVRHKEKTYDRYKYDSQGYEYYKEEYNEPHIIIKQILSCEHTSLGQSVIDEITVEGFQTTDLAYGGGFFGEGDLSSTPEKVNVNLWVDVNTFLPVRLEEDIVTDKGTHIHEVIYDFRWNVIVNPDDFDPNIPEDYRAPVGDIVIPAFNEENAIKGLKLFSDVVGEYPVSLSLEVWTITREYMKYTGLDPNSYKELSDEERTRITSEMISLESSSIFYNNVLVKDNKDPAYYGEMVEPGDTDKVLLRWKLDDGQYRVIFGDLRATTVTAEELAELEKP